MSKRRRNSISTYWKSIIILFALAGILNIVAWTSRSFCDAYIKYIFPIWGRLYGIVTGLTDRSVGEVLLYLAVILLTLAILAILGLIIIQFSRKKNRLKKGLQTYLKVILFIVALESLVMTLNCFILYHASSFRDKYMSDMKTDRQYTIEELAAVRELVISRANELATHFDRDENGNLIYDGDMAEEAIAAMQNLGKTYPELAGCYGQPKPFATSEFFSQQYMMGYYFPFSMEANYNDVMYIANIPATMCHELAHTKGFIYENDANFIGFLACLHSEDEFIEYCGYMSIITYLSNDLYKSLGRDRELFNRYTQASDLVKHDRVFLTKEAWESVEKNAVIDTETVKEASNKFLDTNLKVNGIDQGIAMYSEVVEYLIDYYMSGKDNKFKENNAE